MNRNINRKAFTMIELVFVIVVIGILSAVAIPKLAVNRDDAEVTVAKTTLASIRNAIASEHQKRILKGDFTAISDLGTATNVFDTFDDENGTEVMAYPMKNCATGETGCWYRTDATHYQFRFPITGTADFILKKNKLECDSDDTDCAKLTR